ncbi:tellurite resistance protein TerC [Pasteurella testudinis DSM 23072]|uniref:Tellurite resistance protein TerC n=1 Tax=Pasteurella testudinis DSM 23072 TaxID=1122938 RepID=A0A1W1UR18_9PAST|nr:TerC family protein [Pasteurella testudinis]SMB83459.1 tellurite resistance protein TerC [Pasteurella testudinis DSM 23072]SUB51085.1 Inner membrane protein alx [Pasteurella testudinis]
MANPSLPDIGSPMFYGIFSVVVVIMLAIDLLSLKKSGAHKVSVKEAMWWSVVWVSVSCLFALWLYFELASNPAYGSKLAGEKVMEFLTGYVLEKSLSVDNLFVFLMIFSYFKVPPQYQHKVLLYGVLGAIIMRTIMIAIGAILIREYEWILYIFGIFLVYSGFKIFTAKEGENGEDLSKNWLLNWLRRHLRLSSQFDGEKFLTVENGKKLFTPLVLVLIMVELSDVVFAVDSIPAVFAVTTDPFIVLTSNIFAILGLRAMYFVLADIADRFVYLKYGLAVILIFIGIKMLLVMTGIHIPIALSMTMVFIILIVSVLASLRKKVL